MSNNNSGLFWVILLTKWTILEMEKIFSAANDNFRNIPKLRIKILFPIQNLRHLAFNENGTCYSAILDHLYQAVNTWCLKDVDWNYKYVVMFSDHTQENQSLSTYISSRKRYCNRDSTCSFAIMIWKFAFCPVLKTKGQTSIFLSTLSF